MTDESGKKKRTKLWAVIGVIVAIVIGVTAAIAVGYGGAYLYFNAQAAKAYGVPLVVNAKGLDTDRGTKISVHATGKDSKDNGVDSVFYIGSSSSNIALKPGDYSLAIEGIAHRRGRHHLRHQGRGYKGKYSQGRQDRR
ncbi:hypothetical protein ACLD53_00110 [Gardnerella swidsinskii]|uniref:hypothetical protein n=1 Tax=Gardnerella swidsinskii TaxID=2792979 RepID=UPI003970B5EE